MMLLHGASQYMAGTSPAPADWQTSLYPAGGSYSQCTCLEDALYDAACAGCLQGCGRGFLQALAATWVVSVLLVAVLLLAPEQVLSFFADAKVMPFAKTYCMIR